MAAECAAAGFTAADFQDCCHMVRDVVDYPHFPRHLPPRMRDPFVVTRSRRRSRPFR